MRVVKLHPGSAVPKLGGVEPAEISCPYCGEMIDILVDTSTESQIYMEDCQVCFRPMNVTVSIDEEGVFRVDSYAEDEI